MCSSIAFLRRYGCAISHSEMTGSSATATTSCFLVRPHEAEDPFEQRPVERLTEQLFGRCAPAGGLDPDRGGGLTAHAAPGDRRQRLGVELGAVERSVETAGAHQLDMRPRFGHPSTINHQDLVGVLHRGQPVGDQDRRAPRQDRLETGQDLPLGLGIDRRQRVVEDQDLRLRRQRARQRHPLPLATRKGETALADQRVVPVGEGGQVGRQAGRLRRALHPLEVDRSRHCAATPNPMFSATVAENRKASCGA